MRFTKAKLFQEATFFIIIFTLIPKNVNNKGSKRQMSKYLSGSLWLRQPVEDLRFDLGISFYGFTRCSWTIPNLRKSPFVIRALLAPCAAVAVR